jgi:predicted chitinase
MSRNTKSSGGAATSPGSRRSPSSGNGQAAKRPAAVPTDALDDRMAKFLERYPGAGDIHITSARDGDHGAVSHHFGLHYLGSPTAAIDIVVGEPADDAKMRDLAKWLYDNYADHTVELIHSTDGDGFYVKNQVKSPGGAVYGGPETIGHFGYIHWATSADLLAQAEKPADRGLTNPLDELLQPPPRLVPAPGEPAELAGIANTDPVWGWYASDADWDPMLNRHPMNLVEAQRDGISFFTYNATQGTSGLAEHYKQALERARDAGIPVLGSSHLLRRGDVEAQVQYWMKCVDSQTPWWKDFPWIWQVSVENASDSTAMPDPEEIERAVFTVERNLALRGTAGYVVAHLPQGEYGDELAGSYDIWYSDVSRSGSPRAFKEQYQGVTDVHVSWNAIAGRPPRALEFTADAEVGTQSTCRVNKFGDDLHSLVHACGRDPGVVGAPVSRDLSTEKVLNYNHDPAFLKQDTGFWCGPASTQVVLNALNIDVPERELANEIGTTENGTNDVSMIERVLDRRVPAAKYTSVSMPNDPPTQQQRETLWSNIVQSIDAGYGVVMNWWAPSNNFPRGVKGSASPSYRGQMVKHYVACMGYDSNPVMRAVRIADSGFNPHEYWITFDQCATLIPPKGYAYATAGAVPAVTAVPAAQNVTVAPSASPDAAVKILSQAMGGTLSLDRYGQLLPRVVAALQNCQCNSVNRIALWMSQVGHESGGLQFMEEIASGQQYEGRVDLGNTQPGDGRRFKGRGPIQVTGRSNYTTLSKWAFQRNLVPSATFFVDQPEQLGSDEFGFIGVVWYWTSARDMNKFADAGDIEGGSVAVNGRNAQTGRANGIEDRIARWNRCLGMGNDLLGLVSVAISGAPSVAQPAVAQPTVAQPTGVVGNASAGVDTAGWPLPWRFAFSRSPRDFNQIVDDPDRQPWRRRQPDGTEVPGHTDAFEQIVTIDEQIAWTHTFSDGITRDTGDVLLELMEFAIAWRRANNQSPSAFAAPDTDPDPGTDPEPLPAPAPAPVPAPAEPVVAPATRSVAAPAKRPAKAAKKAPAKAVRKVPAKATKKVTAKAVTKATAVKRTAIPAKKAAAKKRSR